MASSAPAPEASDASGAISPALAPSSGDTPFDPVEAAVLQLSNVSPTPSPAGGGRGAVECTATQVPAGPVSRVRTKKAGKKKRSAAVAAASRAKRARVTRGSNAQESTPRADGDSTIVLEDGNEDEDEEEDDGEMIATDIITTGVAVFPKASTRVAPDSVPCLVCLRSILTNKKPENVDLDKLLRLRCEYDASSSRCLACGDDKKKATCVHPCGHFQGDFLGVFAAQDDLRRLFFSGSARKAAPGAVRALVEAFSSLLSALVKLESSYKKSVKEDSDTFPLLMATARLECEARCNRLGGGSPAPPCLPRGEALYAPLHVARVRFRDTVDTQVKHFPISDSARENWRKALVVEPFLCFKK
ncbi:hypothetical protein SEUCBS140593_010830 [Sporothrix eucalyptigena]|uniref:Uncharacterized protein n=1 Tax=Sporothrix eucalyptigena TaxID=1812306 RepID=A0ABP0D3E3_9PEZI